MKIRSIVAACALGSPLVLALASDAHAFELELRVLLVASGDAETDPSRALMEETLAHMGVPFDVLDASSAPLTSEQLYVSAERGRYNGIILTDSETFVPGGGTGFDSDEFALLHEYERSFGVRESIVSGFPNRGTLGLDYGFGDVRELDSVEGRWQGSAGGSELFEYINTESDLPIEDFSFAATPRDDGEGPVVEPLLVDAANADNVLISRISYEDGREVLLSTVTNADFLLHSRVLAYEFVNFATSGLFIGARHVFLSVHNDDLFLPDETWDPATLQNFPEEFASYRWTAEEVPEVVAAQAAFRERHPLAQDLKIELAFNGVGSDPVADPLTQAVVANAGEFGFINHTFQALQMDRLCTDEGTDCVRTDYDTAFAEISQNAQRWADLGLPNPERALISLLTDSHSGLEDRLGTDDLDDDIPFPDGFNQDFGRAVEDLGIRLLAADASRDNQTSIQRVPGHELVILPRYPTSLFYNVTDPSELVSEYNYIFHDSYVEDGLDPCDAPEALCETRDFEQILDSEANTTLRHMLSSEPFPHYFHQSNLHVYDETGNILQFDWLERVLSLYERWIDLPVKSPRFDQLADIAWSTVHAEELAPAGVLDSSTGQVTLTATGAVTVDVTGVSGGEEYGGQSIASVALSPEGTTLTVDAALDR
ncbi:MAG TPA: hypothetical protein VMG12_10660 [Polyangiaceae bacterium]|nr:hypothetical protein [Polyangiaceae bacterium]